MLGRFGTAFWLVLGCTAALLIGLSFPPLVPRSGMPSDSGRLAENLRQEFLYCAGNLSNLDCACFATKSGHVLTRPQLDIPGTISADRSALARNQASASC